MIRSIPSLLGLAVITFISTAAPLSVEAATVICVHKTTRTLVLRESRCRKTENRITSQDTLIGATGAAGADGSIRIYGDGSAGDLVVSSNAALADVAPDGNTQFGNCTINSGATLTVPSGTKLRCNGTVTINGGIAVQATDASAGKGYFALGANQYALSLPAPSLGGGTAGNGQIGDDSTTRSGGIGGAAFSASERMSVSNIGLIGGGGGAGSVSRYGGSGGGTLVILAKTSISIGASGAVAAPGDSSSQGGGGGGGGIVVLATPGAITNLGTINLVGGNGGKSTITDGVGGGGGGGFLRTISSSFTNSGVISVEGGVGGDTSISVTYHPYRTGGGGGGGSAGAGGNGGDVLANDTPEAAENGSAGATLHTTADPTSLF